MGDEAAQVTGQAGKQGGGTARSRRVRRIAVSASVLALAAGTGLWLSRVPIATGVIDRELARRGVTARYEVADLGLGRQRLTNVVIGDPGDPDLVADWIETVTDVGLSGPRLVAVRAGQVRARARWSDGRLSLGAIDRLLPAGRPGAFTLPALDVILDDARLRLETPYGVAGIGLTGRGRLDGGFAGRFALVGERLGTTDCAARRVAAAGSIRSAGPDGRGGYRLDLAAPVRAAAFGCAGAGVAHPVLATTARLVLGRLAASSLTAQVTTGAIVHPQARAAGLTGIVAGRPGQGSIRTELTARTVAANDLRAGRLMLDGEVDWRTASVGYRGRVGIADADARPFVPPLSNAGQGTPLAPLVRHAAGALNRAAANVSGQADLSASLRDGGWTVAARSARLSAATGARAALSSGEAPVVWRGGDRLSGAGRIEVEGGGLPRASLAFARRDVDAALSATATIAPYGAEGARLALTPIRIDRTNGVLRIATTATVSGPLGDGRVDDLVVPLDARISAGRIAVNVACTPVSFRRLAVSVLTLAPARLTLCPTGPALFASRSGGVQAGVRIAAPRLSGTLGGTPLTLAAREASVLLATRGFTAAGVAAQIGAPGRTTTLDVARLDGRIVRDGVAGTLSGGAGQIANVPLLMSAADGTWRFSGGRLSIDGGLTVADAQIGEQRRFNPLQARDLAFSLQGGTIAASARLTEPATGTGVGSVTIGHRLSEGSGEARIDVPSLTFGDALQPDRLTPLTFGVIADVRGIVRGEGRIAWDARGVTSTGDFATDRIDLAAAFGPVEGLAGTIRFTDLLALESAPGQVATVASINPGVPVTDGRIVYRTLPGTRVAVDGGAWPFAGGRLTLDPTLLDFSTDQPRRMTFRVAGMEAGRFLQQFDFQNLNATGTFDGVLPMIFDEAGGRIEGGRLQARTGAEGDDGTGGGSIAYVGALTEKQLGFWGDFAFQALKSLTYRELDIRMNGPLAGEMVTQVAVAGIRQGEGAKSNFLLRRLTRLPIRFNIRITAPFRGLIDSAASFYDPQRLVQRNLQQLLREQNRLTAPPPGAQRTPPTAAPPAIPIQPPASETVP